ncbi:uncharacterized protein LOC111087255 [Limulus polyphemus]|uniref:Uncharacterized protein LOC111087255 n=1 Tax=Limulus polyphemus TaxID=6850 RepID=A0ABM1SZD2_LIMPO|nr:uncharacterized protein LOC111087255 [Limulus polyphemus]
MQSPAYFNTWYKRRAYELPDGAELLVGNIRTTFSCPGDGYYADVDNDCKIFHVCHTVTHANGKSEVLQWSFLCGNLTFFNQLTLTCGFSEETVQCTNAPGFFYVNGNIGLEDTLFLTEQDIEKAAPLLGGSLPAPAALPPDLRILANQPVELPIEKAPEER